MERMSLDATTPWLELRTPTEPFPACQKPFLGNSPQGAPALLALANAEAQISASQGTYFATVRTIVAMAVTKAKIVVIVSLQLSSSALNSFATARLTAPILLTNTLRNVLLVKKTSSDA